MFVPRYRCRLAMYTWHVMFGEALRLPRRQRDVRLPLFMKIQNVEAWHFSNMFIFDHIIVANRVQ